jgi:hypothetical protein
MDWNEMVKGAQRVGGSNVRLRLLQGSLNAQSNMGLHRFGSFCPASLAEANAFNRSGGIARIARRGEVQNG